MGLFARGAANIILGGRAAGGIWGLIYFSSKGKAKNKEIFLMQKPVTMV